MRKELLTVSSTCAHGRPLLVISWVLPLQSGTIFLCLTHYLPYFKYEFWIDSTYLFPYFLGHSIPSKVLPECSSKIENLSFHPALNLSVASHHIQEKVECNLLPVLFISLFHYASLFSLHFWLFIDAWKWPSLLLLWAFMQFSAV